MKRIEAMMLRDLAPVPPLAPERVLLAALALIFLAVAGIESVLFGTSGWRVLGALQAFTVFPPLVACAGVMAWSLSRLMAPGSRHIISPAHLPLGVVSLLAMLFTSLFHWRQESTFIATGLSCLGIGLACAVPAAALFWLFLRRGAILSPCLAGATAGVMAGLVSLVVLELRCPNLNASHILTWHLGVTVFAMVSGVAIGRVSRLRRNLPWGRCE